MILVNKPEKKGQESGSPVFQELKTICMVLGMSKPPANITMMQFFSGIEKKVSWKFTFTFISQINFHKCSVVEQTCFIFFSPLAKRSR